MFPHTHTQRVSALLGTFTCLFLSFYLDGLISLLILALAACLFVYIELKVRSAFSVVVGVVVVLGGNGSPTGGNGSPTVHQYAPNHQGDVTIFGHGMRGLKYHIALTSLYGMEESLTANAFLGAKVSFFVG